MADIERKKDLIMFRIRIMEFSLRDNLTPLYRTQIKQTIELYRKTLEDPTSSQMCNDIDYLYEKIHDRWSQLYTPWIKRVTLTKDIFMCKDFLVRKLLEDYANQPFKTSEWVLSASKVILHHNDPATVETEKNLELYGIHITIPFEEMMINKTWVEKKYCAILNRQGNLCSDIQPFIDRCDWSNLAAALMEDRQLVLQIFEGSALEVAIILASDRKKILDGIDEIERKYFSSKLSDPYKFELSAYANKISAGQISNHTKHGSGSSQILSAISSGLSALALSPKSNVHSTSSVNFHKENIMSRQAFGAVVSSSEFKAYSTSITDLDEEKTSLLRNKKTVPEQASNAIISSSGSKAYSTSNANFQGEKTSRLGDKKTA